MKSLVVTRHLIVSSGNERKVDFGKQIHGIWIHKDGSDKKQTEELANVHISNFKGEFPEFRSAEFGFEWVETHEGA